MRQAEQERENFMITKPKFDESVFVCPGAAIVGDVTLGKNVNVW